MIKTSTARLCCDTDVGALGLNLIGFLNESNLFFSGILLPDKPKDIYGIIQSILSTSRVSNALDPKLASMAYVSRSGSEIIGKNLIHVDSLFRGGLMRKVYLKDSSKLVGYILNGVTNYIPRVSGYAGSSKGSSLKKASNDDSVLVLGISICENGLEKTIYISAVADGVSSLGSGFVASSTAIRTFVCLVATTFYLEQSIDLQTIREVFLKTAQELLKRNKTEESAVATTFTATVYPVNGVNIVVHVGDTRAYLFKDNKLVRLTEDHKIPGTTIITRSLGLSLPEPQIVSSFFDPGSTLIVVSDGLYEVVSEDEIASAVDKLKIPSLIVRELIKKAVERRGKDDASIGVIRRIL
ncbi:MAG: serine/threonine-protein phosphatase [Desulfurococcaceae archaeon]